VWHFETVGPEAFVQLCQQRAIAHVAARSQGGPVDPALRVTLNFHPDRRAGNVTTLEAMACDGVVRSQFETGTSNGGLTAHPGGDRWRWESRIFGTAYDGAPPSERPKYGTLNFRRLSTGGSPRFGSCHLRLEQATLDRATFCYPDSVFEPTHFGVASAMCLVDLAEAVDNARALANAQVTTDSAELGAPSVDLLDDYIEAQVHGPLLLDRDIEALVLDPCYRGTKVEEVAANLSCSIEWHEGFLLGVDQLRRFPGYRGARIVDVGVSLARDGRIDARLIGDASRTGRYEERDLKQLWHYLARFGSPGL
jgi:hypothetical protein